MTYVERGILLRNGPPWGFRLYEHPIEGLMVTSIRRQSPADLAGLSEGDIVLGINGVDTREMSESRAMQIIDCAAYTMEVFVGRFEAANRYNDRSNYPTRSSLHNSGPLRSPKELTTTELQLFWEKDMPLKPVRDKLPPPVVENRYQPSAAAATTVYPRSPSPDYYSRPPPTQQPSGMPKLHIIRVDPSSRSGGDLQPSYQQQPTHKPLQIRTIPASPRRTSIQSSYRQREPSEEPLIHPHDPNVSPASVRQLQQEFEAPPIKPQAKKKNYSDSAFYNAPHNYYPTLEEQMDMARKVAKSLRDPHNFASRGASIFERQRQRANKYVREGPDPVPTMMAMNENQVDTPVYEVSKSTIPPPPPPPPPPSYPALGPELPRQHVAKPAPGQPKTMQEYLEKLDELPKTRHTEVDPQQCFDIAAALHNSNSRGAKMFARRFNRARRWDAEDTDDASSLVAEPVSEPIPRSSNTGRGEAIVASAGNREASRMAKVSSLLDQSLNQSSSNRAPPNHGGLHYHTKSSQHQAAPRSTSVSDPPRKTSISLMAAEPIRAEPPKLPDSILQSLPIPFKTEGTLLDQPRTASPGLPSSVGWRPVKFKLAQNTSTA